MISNLKLFEPGAETAFLNQLLGLVLFAILLFSVYRIVRHYLPQVVDQGIYTTLLIVGVVFAAFAYYFLSVFDQSLYFFGLVLSLICAVSLFHPAIAVANLVGFLILRPWELIPNEESITILPRAFLTLFAVSLLLGMFRKQKFSLSKNPTQLWILALGVWVFLSTIVSGNIGDSQTLFFDGYIKSLIVAFLIYQAVETEEDYKTIIGIVLIAVFGVSLFALINTFFIIDGDRLEGRGAIQNANDLAAILIFVLPISVKSILKKEWKPLELLFSGFIIAALALGLWKAQSRAAYLSIFLMALTWFVYKFRAHKKLLIQIVIVAIVGVGILSQLNLGRDSSDLDESRMNRLGYWKAGISMAIRHPALGVGFGQFPNNYSSYGAADFTEHGARTAHSSWILLVSEAGFPALFLVIVLFGQAAVRSWSLMKAAPELLLTLVGYGLCMTFLSHIYIIYPYVLLALIFSYPQNKNSQSIGDQ